jgi:hypothetical protein
MILYPIKHMRVESIKRKPVEENKLKGVFFPGAIELKSSIWQLIITVTCKINAYLETEIFA